MTNKQINLTKTHHIVLELASSALLNKEVVLNEPIDWKTLFKVIHQQNIISITYPLIKDLNLPEDILNQWKKENDLFLLNNVRNISAHFSIHQFMKDANIPYVIIKGIASGSYYPDYLRRTYGDVDILVHPNDYKNTDQLLQENGFQYISEHEKHKLYRKNHVTYELHRRIVGIPSGSLGKQYDQFFNDIIECSIPFKHQDSICLIPSHKHHCVILLIHTAEHMLSSGIGLRHLMDWASFINQMNDEFFMNMKPILKELGIWHLCCVFTALCSKYLGSRTFDWASSIDSTYLEEVMIDLFTLGDFVVEKPTQEESSLQKDKALSSFITLLNKRVRRIPIIDQYPVLMPFGYIFITVRYIGRIFLGKREFKTVKETINRYGERSELLEKLELFKEE